MSPRPPQIILLTGAPLVSTLKWRREDLRDDFEPAFQAFVKHQNPTQGTSHGAADNYARWRAIASEPATDIGSCHSSDCTQVRRQPKSDGKAEADQLYKDVASAEEGFLDHCLLANEEIAEAIEASFANDTGTELDTSVGTNLTPTEELSFMTNVTDSFNTNDNASAGLELLSCLPVMDLKALPSANHLVKLYPQTVTPNFLAGVISISVPRTVTVRPRGAVQGIRQMEIVELLLGDDTAAGLSVTFWLTAGSEDRSVHDQVQERVKTKQAEMRKKLLKLRRGDLVLLTHIALSTFRGKVHGQSLRPSRLHCIHTGVFAIPQEVSANNGRNSIKLQKLRDWLNDFIGPPVRSMKRRGVSNPGDRFSRKLRLDEDLPDDTQ